MRGQLDRLGYARQLTFILLGVWALMLPANFKRLIMIRTGMVLIHREFQ